MKSNIIKIYNAVSNRIVPPVKKLIKTTDLLSNKRSVPVRVDIELLNICNANCIFCAYQFDPRKRKFIDQDVFVKTVDECKKYGIAEIGLTPMLGEAFLDKEIFEKISYIKEQGISVGTLYSNGLHFHKVGVERVLNCGISHLGISLATLDRAAYQAIYRVNKYDDLLNNLKDLLISFRDADKSKISVKSISIEFRLDRPLSELKLLKDYKEYIDKYLSPGVIIGGYNEFDSWSGAIEDNDLLPGMRLIYNTRSIGLPCYRLFNIQVGVNGDIRLCGCRINPKLIKQNSFVDDPLYLGNIKQSSIIDLYNGYKSKEIVKSFLKGNAPDECNMCVWSGHKKTYIRPLL